MRFLVLLPMFAFLSAGCGENGRQAKKDDAEVVRKLFEARLQAGREAMDAKRYDDALAAFQDADRMVPLHREVGDLLTHAQARLEETRRADLITAARRALSENRDEEAIAKFDEADKVFPKPGDDAEREQRTRAVKNLWRKAGVEIGWMRIKGEGLTSFVEYKPAVYAPPANQHREYRVAFRVRDWKPDILATLPEPRESFGLDLSFSAFGDEHIEELTRFKYIEILDVTGSRLTNAGREELKRRVQVQWMSR